MGAPSPVHEDRVHALRDLGFLTGHTVDFRLGRWLRPDVALRDPNQLRLFVADAKATENPSDAATRSRLRAYTSALVPWRQAGFTVRITLAVDGLHRASWVPLADDLVVGAEPAQWATLGGCNAVVWIDLPQRVGHRPAIPSVNRSQVCEWRG